MQSLDSLRDGVKDIVGGLTAAPIYTMLAGNDIARRYKRSRVGQLWLTISMAAMIGGMGVVFSQIFQIQTETFIPFLAVGIIIWSFIQQTLNESCTAFMENEGFIRQLSLPKFTYVIRVLLRNMIIALHNFIIIPIVFVFYMYPINWYSILFIPGLVIIVLNLAWMGCFLAIISARFRDVPQIVQSVLQVIFFLTPIMYRPNQLPADHPLVVYNPIASLIAIAREPLLGHTPPISAYILSLLLFCVGSLAALALAGRYSRRVVYWL